MITKNIFKRYTNLSVLLDVLVNKHLTLVDPDKWEDRNDVYYLTKYKEKRNINTLLALCMTDAVETYHHWKIYASGLSGVCIFLKQDLLKEIIEKDVGVQGLFVEYKTYKELNCNHPEEHMLPFTKRKAFNDELEYRLIYTSDKKEDFKNIKISMECIDRIVVAPWVNKKLFKSIKTAIHSIKGCDNLSVKRSTLIDNEKWKNLVCD